MRKDKSGRHMQMLLATTFLVMGFDSGVRAASAQDKPANSQPAALEANAQAVTLSPIDVQGDPGGTGYVTPSTSVATKTNTPLINIPQSVTVLTKAFIKDQNFQSIDDAVRYVPGVVPHQGEGNRDELIIRGVDSSANFFVNGFRDDVQYFRDLYNTQSIEILKGPSALTFGRGSGGGVLNRTLKEADGTTVREVTAQTGSWGDRRVAIDVGQAINPGIAVRLNSFYEGSETFRDYGYLQRDGVNPTVTLNPTDNTKVKLSYEYVHDNRFADRGNPSQGIFATPPSSTRGNPATPFVSNWATIFGSPIYNVAHSDVTQAMGVIEHDFGSGLSVKNSSLFANYIRGYRNVYPGNGPLSGAVNPSDTAMNLAAYENRTNRQNMFNQTDFTWKGYTGPVKHTVVFGSEFGIQTGLALRNTGFFRDNGMRTVVVNPFTPTWLGQIAFDHIKTDANSRYRLDISSGYAQDQIELTRWLQLFVGARYDKFDLETFDRNLSIGRGRVDEKMSPRFAVIEKPVDNFSIYQSYSVSYLPASGDQFSTLNMGTVLLKPQKFENREVGIKWDISPALQYTAAAYDLKRFNMPIADPSNPGFFLLSGSNRIHGFETSLNGNVTKEWQAVLGYAYTDARVASNTSPTVVAGNRIQLVPFNQVSLWNKYQFNPVWGAAVGVIYFSDSFASSDDSVKLPGFYRVDAAIYAKINETWKAQFNVENVFDKGYWATADGNNNISPGQSRTFRLSAIANF